MMSKRTYIILGILALLAVVSLLALKSYSLEIVHSVVMNAVIQKSPPDFSEKRIRQTFARSYADAVAKDRKSEYLDKLSALSHRLEKVQELEFEEVETILDNLVKE
jgi:hypothetical protein